jgi:predicted MPP superfamily phosphohydrolase
MKTVQKIILVAVMLIMIIGALTYDAFYSAPSRFTVRHETLSSIYIPEQMNDINILFFSDLDYGTFMDEARLNKLVDTINELSPDVVIFGGDMFDQAADVPHDMVFTVAAALGSIQAPLGKFAVFGDFDYRTDEIHSDVQEVLWDSSFEILENTSVMIRNHGSQYVTLVGLDNGLNGTQDINTAYAAVSRTAYTITICHTPDSVSQVPADITKYFLAGHSLGGQVYYGFGSMYAPPMAVEYQRGKHTISGTFTLDISSGVGTTGEDVRFLSNAEVVLYRLQHKSISDLASGS